MKLFPAAPEPRISTRLIRCDLLRQALTAFGDGMSGLGLVQPHVKRTSLCDLQAEALAPEYTAGLARVREWVRAHTLNDGAGGPIALKKSRHPFRTRAGALLLCCEPLQACSSW